jgi:hypothetical protein
MNSALELGVREFRSLRREGERLIGRRCPCAYVALPQGPAEQRLLDQARIGYSACNGSLLVLGQPALDLASSLKLPCLNPFENNRLASNDAISRQVAAALIEAVLAPRTATVHRCAMTAPGEYAAKKTGISTGSTLTQFVRLQGCAPTILSASYAVGLAELGRQSLTGIAFHFGAGECQASLLQQGRELVHVGIPRGEDSLMNDMARQQGKYIWDYEGNCYLHQTAAREWKELARPSLERPVDEQSHAWSELVTELVNELIGLLIAEVADVPGIMSPRGRFSVVYAGSLCDADGFEELLESVLDGNGLSATQIAIRPASDLQNAVVRGLLIYGEVMARDEAEAARPLSNVG